MRHVICNFKQGVELIWTVLLARTIANDKCGKSFLGSSYSNSIQYRTVKIAVSSDGTFEGVKISTVSIFFYIFLTSSIKRLRGTSLPPNICFRMLKYRGTEGAKF